MKLLFDIGGTNMRFAVSVGEKIEHFETVSTPHDFEDAMDLISDYFEKTSSVKSACGGFPGNFASNGTILYAPNLPQWVGRPLESRLARLTKLPVYLQNDAALAGLGEAVYGSGRAYDIVAYVTLSTGVGGARIVDKKIDRVSVGSEPGHQIIDIDGQNVKYIERLLGGRNIEAKFGKAPVDLDNEAFWKQYAKYLALALHNITVFWSPDIIILGGGIGTSKKLPLDIVRSHLEKYLKIFPKSPVVTRAELGEKAGLMGALAFTNSQ